MKIANYIYTLIILFILVCCNKNNGATSFERITLKNEYVDLSKYLDFEFIPLETTKDNLIGIISNIKKEKSTKISPVKLIIRVLKRLIIKEKIPNFSWFYSNYHKVCNNFSKIEKTKNISNFAYWYSKENITGLFKALYYFSKIENKRGKHRLKSMYRPIHYYYQCLTVHYETFRSWH